MVRVQYCWSPCLQTNNLKYGCKVIAYHTIGACLIFIVCVAMDMFGGSTIKTMEHLFEVTDPYCQYVVAILFLLYLCLLVISGLLIIIAIKFLNRILLLPWMGVYSISIVFELIFGFWLLVKMFADEMNTIADSEAYFRVFIVWGWMVYSSYLWLVVYTEYQNQTPNVELLCA